MDCIVTLPGQLFYTTPIRVCLWFLARDKGNGSFRDRHGETLFINANAMGHMTDRPHRDLSSGDIGRIARAYHAWQGKPDAEDYKDIPGFCKSPRLEEVQYHRYALVPGRYVGFGMRPTESWKRTELANEIAELNAQLNQVSGASKSAMALLAEVLDG